VLAVVVVALQASGCLFLPDLGGGRREDWPPAQPPSQPVVHNPPIIQAVTIPDWPPIGKPAEVSVLVTDPDGNLRSVEFLFNDRAERFVTGSSATASIFGSDLGEGLGTLTIQANDTTGAFARQTVTQLLVDLTPPKITLGQTVVAADGELELWVGDAWILGKVTLWFAGVTVFHEFEQGFPETLGKTWDYSLVKFDMSDLPQGSGTASVRAVDAADNAVTETFTLVIDGEPPQVSIGAPEEGALLSGSVEIDLAASDPGAGPVSIELSLGGTPIATVNGPTATVKLDTTDFTPGPTTLVAKATDVAGNGSSVSRAVIIQ